MMNKKLISAKSVILLLFLLMMEISGCVQQEVEIPPSVPEEIIDSKVQPSTPEDSVAEVISKVPEAVAEGIGEHKKQPRVYREIYLGFFFPTVQEDIFSLEEPNELKRMGANSIEFGIIIPYSDTGEIPELVKTNIFTDAREFIQKYKDAGFTVALTPEPIFMDIGDIEPEGIPTNAREKFLEDFEKVVIRLAQIAEEEQVEIFAPMNEVDYKLGTERADRWAQEILPKIKEVYTGKMLWKGQLSDAVDNNKRINFKGYDYAGFTLFTWHEIQNYPTDIKKYLDIVGRWAEEDGAELIATEFGDYDPMSPEAPPEPRAISSMFDLGKGRLKGYFVFEPPRGFGHQIKSTVLEEEVKKGFEKIKN